MATAVARVGDALSHGGSITSGSPNWNCNGIAIARVGDTANCSVHGLVTITTGSPQWTVNGKAMARIGSVCSCGATITSGSTNWTVA